MPYIVHNGVVEENGVLRDHGHGLAQARLSDAVNGLAVNADDPLGGIIEAEEQPQ